MYDKMFIGCSLGTHLLDAVQVFIIIISR